MAQFDLYRLGNAYVIDVQADLLDGLNTRVVVPLLPEAEAPRPASRLNPVFLIEARPHVLVPQFMAAIPLAELGRKTGSLAQERDRIKPAIDMVFDGV